MLVYLQMRHEFLVQSLFQELGIHGMEVSQEAGRQSPHRHRHVVDEVAHAGKRIVTHPRLPRRSVRFWG